MKRVAELIEQGLVHPAGVKAWEARTAERSGVYSFEQRPSNFEPAQARQFRANRIAWKYFASQTPSYRRAMIWWVISAKRDETKARRLASLIEYSQQGQTVPQFTPNYLRKKF